MAKRIGKDLLAGLKTARLEAEVAPSSRSAFEAKYKALTGEAPPADNSYQLQPNKYGTEGRVYFNASDGLVRSLTSAGYNVTETAGYRTAYMYRVNSVQLFWDLVRAGLRLGDNS